jgi:hypothetical protein
MVVYFIQKRVIAPPFGLKTCSLLTQFILVARRVKVSRGRFRAEVPSGSFGHAGNGSHQPSGCLGSAGLRAH